MLRLLIVVAVLIGFTQPTVREPNREALQRAVARASQLTAEASDLVRTRFTLATAAATCGYTSSLYGYNLLLDQFDARQRNAIEHAADEGSSRAVAAAGTPCAATLTRLRASDDDLILLAERVGREPR